MNSIRCSQCEHYIEANAGEGKIYGCDRSRCVFEPTTKNDLEVDCISRADAIRAMQDKSKKLTNEDTINGLCGAVAILYEMPSVTPQPCEDAVSRQAVLDLIADYDLSMGQVVKGIHALPSVTPQEPRKGHWIDNKCTNCGYEVQPWNNTNYCPNCGSRNEVEE